MAALLRWRPPHGVISVYLDIDPADRGEGWRTELRNGIRSLADGQADGDRETRLALAATGKRIVARFPAERPHAGGRTQIGFVEVSPKEGREAWYSVQLRIPGTEIVHHRFPFVRPLLALLDDGAPLGVVAVSAERVRLLHWSLGQAEEVERWGLELFSLDWRERKAQRTSDPAAFQGAKAAGRDQFGQRLDANRERFLHETGRLTAAAASDRGWRQVIGFGDERHVRAFEGGFGPELRHVENANLIAVPIAEIEQRVEKALEPLNRTRERTLVDRVKNAAHAGDRGALGIQETLQSLAEGRVAHLLFDAQGRPRTEEAETSVPGEDGDLPLEERMIELAVASGAAITPLEGEAAEALAESEGVAALLRY